MSQKELNEWAQYYAEEPFMNKVIEVQLATLTEVVLKSFTKDSDLSAIDFMITVSSDDKNKIKEEAKRKELFEKLNNFGI